MVTVYVPLGGFVAALFTELLPHAISANPAAANAIRQARLRFFREERPRNPASNSPAKANPAGPGLGPLFRLVFPPCSTRNGCKPPFEPPVAEMQSEALASSVNCVVAGVVPVTPTEPPPLVRLVVKE